LVTYGINQSRRGLSKNNEIIKKNVLESMQNQVENFIRDKIGSGEWGLGAKIPSERELSERLEVSRTTVRNAVQALTNRGLFERKIGQGTFVRTLPAGPTASVRANRGTLGYVICKERAHRKPLSSEAFYFDVFAGIEEETVSSGRHLLFCYLDDQNPDELDSFGSFVDKVDGLVLEEVRNPALLQSVCLWGVPTVLMAPTTIDSRLDLVTMDLEAGVRRAVDLLLKQGHRSIGVINGPLRFESARVRFNGWKEALRASGIEPETRLADGDLDWTAEAGFRAMDRLADRCPDLTAVFCANDLLAIGALAALARKGRRVPQDISVVGFDDSELARHSVPPLTSMKIHTRAMARAAVRRVLERLETADLPPIVIEFPIDPVVRQSTGALPENSKQGG
jgi:LacI family transcriptional regulator